MALSKKYEKILESIRIASHNDPLKPEFPPNKPSFPATPTFKIEVPGFSNVWLKDESVNPTGTHKDRMAWEVIVLYRDFLLARQRNQVEEDLPRFSIISAGSAAIAIQTMLKKYHLPDLSVLVNVNLNKTLFSALEKLGCNVYQYDLAKKPLTWRELLELTQNQNGFDLSSSDVFGQTTTFYDWMSYEILNNSPDYCFMPFGTGNLFQNVLNITKKEVSSSNHDPRFSGSVEVLRNCCFLGATVNDPKSKAEKLYAPHNPFSYYSDQWIHVFRSAGYCNENSGVYNVKEQFIDEAMGLASSQGINTEYSGITGLALLLQMKNFVQKDKKILIVNTGKTKVPV